MKIKTVSNDTSTSKWDIHPDFKNLKRIPVPKTLSQVRSIQLIFRRRMHRETSTEHFDVKRIKLKSSFSQKKEIKTLIYSSKSLSPDEKAPCLYFIHGGAFLLPALPYHYRFARLAAKELRCRVVMPMYDLAPYQVPPIQQEEIFEIYKCLIDTPERFHIDPDKIIVTGDSAGGTLAAALCLMARDRNAHLPLAQALFYPSLDVRLNTESMKRYTDVPVCNAESIREYYRLCRPEEYYGNNAYRSPIEADSLKGLPAAYIETAEFDALHDDGVAYAKRLESEGCNVVLNETKGTVHAFEMAKNSEITKAILKQRIEFMRNALQTAPS